MIKAMTRRALFAAAVLGALPDNPADRKIYRDWFQMIAAKAQGQKLKAFLCACRLQAVIEAEGVPPRWAALHSWLCRHPGGETWPMTRDTLSREDALRILRGDTA